MKTVRKFIMATTALIALGGGSGHGTLRAEEATQRLALKPILGANALLPARQSLLDFTLGAKQVIGYFDNEKGQCKVTIIVADAFDDAGGHRLSRGSFRGGARCRREGLDGYGGWKVAGIQLR